MNWTPPPRRPITRDDPHLSAAPDDWPDLHLTVGDLGCLLCIIAGSALICWSLYLRLDTLFG